MARLKADSESQGLHSTNYQEFKLLLFFFSFFFFLFLSFIFFGLFSFFLFLFLLSFIFFLFYLIFSPRAMMMRKLKSVDEEEEEEEEEEINNPSLSYIQSSDSLPEPKPLSQGMCFSKRYFPFLFENAPTEIPSTKCERCIPIHPYESKMYNFIAKWYEECRENIREYFEVSEPVRKSLPSPGERDIVVHLRGLEMRAFVSGKGLGVKSTKGKAGGKGGGKKSFVPACQEFDVVPPRGFFDRILERGEWEKVFFCFFFLFFFFFCFFLCFFFCFFLMIILNSLYFFYLKKKTGVDCWHTKRIKLRNWFIFKREI